MPDYNREKKDVYDILADQVINGEVNVAKQNQDIDNIDFENFVALLDAERQEKDYDWMSDIRIPEFASHFLTQSSVDVAQYFQTRDFVEVYLEDEGDEAIANSNASKELINRTLNQRHLYHYAKYVRGKGINNLCGRVYLKVWWEQSTRQEVIDYETRYEMLDVDNYGQPLMFPEQQPAYRTVSEPIIGEVAVIDRFNYDVWDQRNVFMSNEYVYSLQQKQWVTFRSEMTLPEIEAVAEQNGYFNLDKLKGLKPADKTKTAEESYDKYESTTSTDSSIPKKFDIYERYGSFWATLDRDENGEPVQGTEKIGIDNEGKSLESAEMVEVIITVAANADQRCLIGFKLNPYKDAYGMAYRPVIRGLCYIHPTKDGGVGDGKYTKELQIAIDDTFNISQDRVMLATLPTIKTAKHNVEDNSTLYFEPGHRMEFDKDPNEIQEFKISDNIVGALNQINLLTTKMQQVDSVQPPAMGQAGAPSTTATAFAGASYATGERANYKSLTFENTALCELYWMIQQMTFQFAQDETMLKLMGNKVYDFDPSKDYYYKPVSQSIEPEYSKNAKIKTWQGVLGYVVQLVGVHEDAVNMVNYIIGQIAKLSGDEFANFSDALLNPQKPVVQQGGTAPVANTGGVPVSNQNAVPMSGAELGTRGMANIGAY